jgi:uncharacterized protein YkwD
MTASRVRIQRAIACCAMVVCAGLASARDRPDPSPGKSGPADPAQSAYPARLLGEINAYRVQHGERALVRSASLDDLARSHSEDMASARKLSHDGFRERMIRSGRPACVENVGWNYPTPAAQRRGWSESPAHDTNMLDPQIAQAGTAEVNGYVTFIGCR